MTATHSPAAIEIGRRIRETRNAAGVSLEELGPLCGISWTNIGKIERGLSSPSVQTLVHIATGLGIDPGSLISGISAADYDKAPKRRFTVQEFLAARAEAETDQ